MKQQKIEINYRDIGTLSPRSANPRTHSDEQIAQIQNAIRSFGWTNPILIDPWGEIIAGHGRFEAAKRLGLETVPTITLEGLSESEIRALVIADNKIPLSAEWDPEILRSELQALEAEGFGADAVGFSEAELRAILGDAPEMDEDPRTEPSAESKLGDLVYRVIVTCPNEQKQAEVHDRLQLEGLPCQMLMS